MCVLNPKVIFACLLVFLYFIYSFADVLTLAEDLEIDNPKIWQFYGELMSPIIEDGTISLRSIKLAVKPLIARTKTVDVLYEITGGAIKREVRQLAILYYVGDATPNDNCDIYIH